MIDGLFIWRLNLLELSLREWHVFGDMAQASRTKKPDVKIVILGDMNVGKTSLLHRYTERKFKDTISTVGGAFFLKQWGPYNISIWDTAGELPLHFIQ